MLSFRYTNQHVGPYNSPALPNLSLQRIATSNDLLQNKIDALRTSITNNLSIISSLDQQINTLQQQVTDKYNDSTIINTTPPQVPVEAQEMELLLNVRSNIISYFDANHVVGTIYNSNSSFTLGLKSIIGTYLQSSTVTLTQAQTMFSNPSALQLRTELENIYNSNASRSYDSFNTDIRQSL